MHNDENPDVMSDFFVNIGAGINIGFYWALAGLYGIIVEIAESTILSSDIVAGFFARVQLIIGIFMIFRLSMTILQGIVDPDKAVNSEAGMGNIIVKIITGLVLLSMLVPISNIPNTANKYEKRVKNNGILFGTLYEFQSRVLRKNIIGKLVLAQDEKDAEAMGDMGKGLATGVLKSFLVPNMKATVGTNVQKNKETGRYKQSDLECDLDKLDSDHEGYYDLYYGKDATTTELLSNADRECERVGSTTDDQDRYQFNFSWFLSLLVVIAFDLIFIVLCVQIAKRAIKLAILRLIAPIPIISYMGSTSDIKSSRLGAWFQLLVSTYVDLFVTLAMIFFAMTIIVSIAQNGLTYGDDGTEISILGKVFIYIALLLFVLEGPKFIKQALGMKDEGNGMLSGLGKAIGVGAGVAALGGKKLAGGLYSKARGGSFREGAGQFQSDNKLFAAKRNLDQTEAVQANKELKGMHKDWKKANKWWEKQEAKGINPADVFDGKNAKAYEDYYGNKEFAASAMAVDSAKNELDAASQMYNEKYAQGTLTNKDVEAYEKAQKKYEGKVKTHEAMRKKHTLAAAKEDRYKVRKYNDYDPTNVKELPTYEPEGPSYAVHADDINERYNVSDGPTQYEHQQQQQEYDSMFNNSEISKQIDANERAADQKYNNNNNKNKN